MSAQRLYVLSTLVFPLLLACSDDAGEEAGAKFTSGDASAGEDSSTVGESGDMTGDGDGDMTGDGDGDMTGDGDGDMTGDGDGDMTGDGDGDDPDQCETPAGEVGTSCGQDAGLKGAVAFGETMADLPVGAVSMADNGQGNGAEDWYRIDFPLDAANPRPLAGTASISFALNQGGDYRFEVYRDCGAQVYGQGLAAEFGSNAPPLLEWTFNDFDPGGLEQADYLENVAWPASVWVRVFRFQNDGECNNYQLQVSRN